MKKIDRLIIGEIFGPWVFGVAIFTVLIMAGSFLFTFTRFLSLGIPLLLVIKLTALLLPGILAKTFSMAMLLGTLLAFGRLSGDSEIVALRAGGVSVVRIMAPVAAFGLMVSLLTYAFTDYVVPGASYQASAMRQTVEKSIDTSQKRPTSRPISEKGKLAGYVVAEDYSLADGTLTNAKILKLSPDGQVESVLEVPKLMFDTLDKWQIYGRSRLHFLNAGNRITVDVADGIWPEGTVRPTESPKDMSAGTEQDLDTRSSHEIRHILETTADMDKATRINWEFGYWNKFSLPLAALIFGLVGAPLGIRNHRAGTATGFWLSVIIIFGYMLVTNALSIMAQGGAIPAWLASFGPVLVGGIVAVELIRRKNQQ